MSTIVCEVCGRNILEYLARRIPGIGFMCPQDDPECRSSCDVVTEAFNQVEAANAERELERSALAGLRELHHDCFVENADAGGVSYYSAADQCSALYVLLGRLGMKVN